MVVVTRWGPHAQAVQSAFAQGTGDSTAQGATLVQLLRHAAQRKARALQAVLEVQGAQHAAGGLPSAYATRQLRVLQGFLEQLPS